MVVSKEDYFDMRLNVHISNCPYRCSFLGIKLCSMSKSTRICIGSSERNCMYLYEKMKNEKLLDENERFDDPFHEPRFKDPKVDAADIEGVQKALEN